MEKQTAIFDQEDIRSKLNEIVEELSVQAESRDRVSGVVKTLKEKYDLKPTLVRKVAKVMADAKFDEIAEEAQELKRLIAIACS